MEVLAGAPLLSRITTGRAKKEGAMQEMNCNGGGGGGGGNRDSRAMEVSAMRIPCCLSKNCAEPRQSRVCLCRKQLFNFGTAYKRLNKFKCL